MTDKALVWSYAVYLTAFEAIIFGTFGWAVFDRGYSGWWMLLAIVCSSMCFKPERWKDIVNQEEYEDDV